MALTKLLGAGVLTLLAGEQFETLPDAKQLELLGSLLATSEKLGGHATDPDTFEAMAAEIVMYTPGSGGQGVSYSDVPLDAGAPGWTPMANLASLDPYDQVDYATHLVILWEVIKMMRPTRAGSGTNVGTAPAAGTTSDAPTGPTAGSPTTQTQATTGARAYS